jgi:ketosteroid isomerase-like protein
MNTQSDAAEEIRALVNRRAEATRAKDVAGATSMTAPDMVLFDVINPHQSAGPNAAAKRAAEWFATFKGPIGFEVRNLHVSASGDVGFSHGLYRVNATKLDGKPLDMWWRGTVCYRKIDGNWIVTHEHASVPFDTATGKASVDLKPSE